MSLVMTAETGKRLLGVWQFLCWLDKATWCAANMTNELAIPGPVFEKRRPE
jgi:hypothetical protein